MELLQALQSTCESLSRQQISIIPVGGDKKPMLASWRKFADAVPPESVRQGWFQIKNSRRFPTGIAIVAGRVSRLVCIDADSRDIGIRLYRSLPTTEMMTRTPSGGVHFWYRIAPDELIRPRVRIGGYPIDIRGEGSYAIIPPSIRSDGQSYIRIGNWNLTNIPFFDQAWLEHLDGGNVRRCGRDSFPRIRNLRAYLRRVESRQGENGSAGLVRACHLIRNAGLSESEATVMLLEWNQDVADPPWSTLELTRAITRVYQQQ